MYKDGGASFFFLSLYWEIWCGCIDRVSVAAVHFPSIQLTHLKGERPEKAVNRAIHTHIASISLIDSPRLPPSFYSSDPTYSLLTL